MAEKTETIVESKFIFTNEGRCSLTSQDGGIRFAVLGAVLVQGLEPVKLEEEDKEPNPLDGNGHSTSPFYNKYRTITLDDLTPEKGVRLGLKEIKYRAIGNERIEPENIDDYMDALHHIENYLLPLKYRHAGEVKDKFGNVYGEYQFDCDRTTLNWDPDSGNDISFAHICLIGKQYSETNDAAFNVNQTQKPVVVGIAQIAGSVSEDGNVFTGGIQLLADQNDYVDILLKLRFTLDENDYDIGTMLDLDEDANEVLEISKKFSLVNNGLKTDSTKGVKMSIVSNKDTIVDLNLDNDGTIATSRTLMVADAYDAHELENQWNAAGLIHIINKQDDDNRYKEQLILSTIERYEDLTDELTAYNAGMMLKGSNPEIIKAGFNNPYIPVPPDADPSARNLTAEGPQPPMFTLNAVPNYDKYVAEFFGEENTYLGSKNIDKTIFSKYNITFNPNIITEETMDDSDGNILINSNYNFVTNANADNTLINSDYNVLSANAFTNMLIGADANIINNYAAGNIIIGTNRTIIENTTTGSIILGGEFSRLSNSKNMRLFGIEGLLADGKENGVIFGKWNKDEAAGIIYGNGTDDGHRSNALAFYPRDSRLSLIAKDGKQMDIAPSGLTFPEGASLDVDTVNTDEVIFSNGWKFSMGDRGSFLLQAIRGTDSNPILRNAMSFSWPTTDTSTPDTYIYGNLQVQGNNGINVVNGGVTADNVHARGFTIKDTGYTITTAANGSLAVYNYNSEIFSVNQNGDASFKGSITQNTGGGGGGTPIISPTIMPLGEIKSVQRKEYKEADLIYTEGGRNHFADLANKVTRAANNMYEIYWNDGFDAEIDGSPAAARAYILIPEPMDEWQYLRLIWENDTFNNTTASFHLTLVIYSKINNQPAYIGWQIVDTGGVNHIGHNRTVFVVAYRFYPFNSPTKMLWNVMSMGENKFVHCPSEGGWINPIFTTPYTQLINWGAEKPVISDNTSPAD